MFSLIKSEPRFLNKAMGILLEIISEVYEKDDDPIFHFRVI